MAFSFTELETLMKYGFTAEQIMELNGQPAEPQPEPQTEPQTESAAETETIAALRQEIADLKSTIQKQNIITKSVDTLTDNDKTVENALASLIRPPYEEKKK